jgi:hypothetical protein
MRYDNEGGLCRTEIGNQAGLGSVEYSNVVVNGLPALHVSAKINGITYTRTHTSSCLEGAEGTFSDGTYQGEWTVVGTKSGVPVGAEFESAPATKFAAEEAPATIAGNATSSNSLTFGANGSMSCTSTKYNGTQSALTSVSITTAPVFHGCSINRSGTVTAIPDEYISAGACSYEWKETGGFAIVGASCASNPLSVTVPGCAISVGPQSGFPGFVFSNEGAGKLRKVIGTQSSPSPGLTYTAAGGGCASGAGTFSNGTYRGSAKFSATNSKAEAQGFWIE